MVADPFHFGLIPAHYNPGLGLLRGPSWGGVAHISYSLAEVNHYKGQPEVVHVDDVGLEES